MNTKKTIAILGATGMLGNALYAELKDAYRLILAVRDPAKIALLEQVRGNAPDAVTVTFDAAKLYDDFVAKKGFAGEYWNNFIASIATADYVINAIGVTIPFSLENPALTFFINSALPHILADFLGEKLIHITTDCAYNGLDGFPYDEHSRKTPVDFYGLSKSMGEPTNCLTLRTSIIGRELEGFAGLLEWFLHQEGKTVTGFANHFWNGITTKQFAKVCDTIMRAPEQFPRTGIFHVFSTSLSKYDMLIKFREKYGITCDIQKDETKRLNRTLATSFDVQKKLNIPSFDAMLANL